jgi:hypothetical protein
MSVFGNFPLDGKNTVVYVEIPLFVVTTPKTQEKNNMKVPLIYSNCIDTRGYSMMASLDEEITALNASPLCGLSQEKVLNWGKNGLPPVVGGFVRTYTGSTANSSYANALLESTHPRQQVIISPTYLCDFCFPQCFPPICIVNYLAGPYLLMPSICLVEFV